MIRSGPAARCNDGSPAVYYRPARQTAATRVLVYLQVNINSGVLRSFGLSWFSSAMCASL